MIVVRESCAVSWRVTKQRESERERESQRERERVREKESEREREIRSSCESLRVGIWRMEMRDADGLAEGSALTPLPTSTGVASTTSPTPSRPTSNRVSVNRVSVSSGGGAAAAAVTLATVLERVERLEALSREIATKKRGDGDDDERMMSKKMKNVRIVVEEVDRLMRSAKRQMQADEEDQRRPSTTHYTRRGSRADVRRIEAEKNHKLYKQLTHRRNKAVYSCRDAASGGGGIDTTVGHGGGRVSSVFASTAASPTPRSSVAVASNDAGVIVRSNPLADDVDLQIQAMDVQEGDELMLRIAEEKQREMLRTVTAMHDLKEVMVDMSVLVQQQGEGVDAIANNLDHAAVVTEAAKNELTKAKRLQDINRRRMCIFATVLFFIFGGTGFILYILKENNHLGDKG